MPSNTHLLLLTTLLYLPPTALAATIHRCEAPDGHITFTTMSCRVGENLSLQDVHPFLPGTIVAVLPEATFRETSDTRAQKKELTVVGQSEDKCGNVIDAKQRREAIINQRVVAGMSQQDVESALGKPDKINIRNSATSYRYDLKRGRSAHVDFDEKGCVKGKAKPQTAKSPR
ncbi:cell envelope protein SmpA [Pseudomonas frederiksbergensis]|uniref:Cell envelope protein SmpA n=1 Tax=Pseudomonas frederiksbergensis TaxID=104087 RepID=A0A423JU67_9PSED|nr:cell envelope protein SmpA [Pseudomonas frederiksbergensis]RON41240.1 cell envelope protein SmpA [Pseudomonas frederiksbergensis]